MSGSMDAPEDVVAQCEELDLVLNVFRDGVNGSIRSYPIPVQSLVITFEPNANKHSKYC